MFCGAVARGAILGSAVFGSAASLSVVFHNHQVVALGFCCAEEFGGAPQVAATALRLHADEVGAEQTFHDLLAKRQPREKVGRRERNMQEEADLHIGPLLTQHFGQELQVIVVNPDGGAGGGDRSHRIAKSSVHLHIAVPPCAMKLGRAHAVVVERPDGGVGHARVIKLCLGTAERHRQKRHVFVAFVELGGGIACHASPADPVERSQIVQAREHGRHQTARARLPLVLGRRPAHGQPIGSNHEMRCALRGCAL